MLSVELNQRLTQVGPDTPMGKLLRYYWHPIAGSAELEVNPVKKVRVLCEDLVLYRDKSGALGLIDEPCPHRRVSLEYGIPEPEGVRCPYHGWVFNHEGRCLEQPAEPWDSTFKERVTTKAYPVQELGGLIFAYLGPQPAPLLPRYEPLVADNMVRHIGVTLLPCNWLQCMENSLDPVHVEWLHGYYSDYVWSRKVPSFGKQLHTTHKKIGFDRFEHGIIKRRVVQGATEEDDPWKVGHPIIFPHILATGGFQYRVPVDDTHTLHLMYTIYRPGVPVPPQETIPVYEIPLYDENGKFMTEVNIIQDMWAWATQGPVAEREKEKLGQSDIGIIMYRELLMEQLARMERGEEPMEVYRDPAKNVCISLPREVVNIKYNPEQERKGNKWFREFRSRGISHERFSPLHSTIQELYRQAEERLARGEPLLPQPQPPVYPVGGDAHKAVVLKQ